LNAPVALKDGTLEIVAKGSNEAGEKLNNMSVTLLDADKKRCARYTKSVGVDETPVSIKIVEMDKSNPDFNGDLSKVSQISISFAAKQGEAGKAFVSEAKLILP
jgi:acylphosphatase